MPLNRKRYPRISESWSKDESAMTCKEIAKELGVSREAIEQTLRRAMWKLREEFHRRGVRSVSPWMDVR